MIRTTIALAAWLVIVSWKGTAMAGEKGQTKHKVGIKIKRLCCGWSHDYLYRVLTQDDQGL